MGFLLVVWKIRMRAKNKKKIQKRPRAVYHWNNPVERGNASTVITMQMKKYILLERISNLYMSDELKFYIE
jgi:hypothetical protein